MSFNNLVLVWLFLVSIFSLFVFSFSLWVFTRLNRLIKGADEKRLVEVFGDLAKNQRENKEFLDRIKKSIEEIESKNLLNVQKIGLVRFNPFSETGGDHSFSLALLDGKNNGFVMTGLHTRERTRLYVKPIKDLKSSYELSTEEQKAINEALKKK